MRNRFDEQLHTLNHELLEMGALIERAIRSATDALVKQDVDLESDYRTASYNGEKMFWSDSYGTYCFLVIAETLSLEDAKAQVGILDEAPGTLYNDCDVNWTGNVDASDAQLVYNMYNAMYDAFTDDASMEKFLSADVNKDEKVDELIREALKKEVENIYVPNKMKEEIDAIIERKMHYEKKCK